MSLSALLLSGCGGSSSANAAAGPSAVTCDAASEYCGSIPLSVNACTDTTHFPLTLESATRPLTVHYSRKADAQKATELVDNLEFAWTIQVDDLGFDPPLGDGGACGADGRYDVFIWHGVDGAYVDAVGDNPATTWDDYTTYMAIDTHGLYGGAYMETTLAHEFNHSVQASDDWWEGAAFFEMSATFAEALTWPDEADYYYTLNDFQQHPDWSLFYDDGYDTWYMYGAAMYLHFLYEHYYPDDPAFIARIWRAARSDPSVARPDFLDAMRTVLMAERGVNLDDTVAEFMQWRWFVAEFDDGMHFRHGAEWPAAVAHQDVDAGTSQTLHLNAMPYGANYLSLGNTSPQAVTYTVELHNDLATIDWRLATVHGQLVGSTLTIPAESAVVLVATALPGVADGYKALDFSNQPAELRLTVN